jgi:hypothetical protein
MAKFLSEEYHARYRRKKSCGCCVHQDDSSWVAMALGFVLILMTVLVLSSCASAQRRDPFSRTVGGAAVGAAAGAAGGAIAGNPGKGAAIGAVAGAVVGLLSGDGWRREPCAGEYGNAYRVCMAGYYQENANRAYRRGLCEGGGSYRCSRRGRGYYGDNSYYYHYRGGGYRTVVPLDRPAVLPYPLGGYHQHYYGCGHHGW